MAPPKSLVKQEAAAYTAPFPYYVKVKKKGRRTYESTLVKGILHGTMPVVAATEAKPVFEVTHANGIKVRIDGWNGALWAPFRDLDGAPLTFDRFKEVLTGKDIESRYPAETVRLFDPFSSPLNWKDGEPWAGVVLGGHISNNPEAPKDTGGITEHDGEAEALARATRIAGHLAVIGGVVCLKIPGPMWQVSVPDEPRRRGEKSSAQTVMRPEWRIPMRQIAGDFRIQQSVADHRPGPVMTDGNFFAWNRKDAAKSMAVRKDGSVVEEGAIEVLDQKLAVGLTGPGDDLAASGMNILTPIVAEASKQLYYMSDRAVEAWTVMRKATRALEHVWYGDRDIVKNGFRALETVMEEFEESARDRRVSGSNMVSIAAPTMRRWQEFEKKSAPSVDIPELDQDTSAADDHAISGLNI